MDVRMERRASRLESVTAGIAVVRAVRRGSDPRLRKAFGPKVRAPVSSFGAFSRVCW